jgi:glucokinase
MLLAGDVWGTKTDLAICSFETGTGKPLIEATFPSAEYASFESIVAEFLGQQDLTINRASFGMAGLVVGSEAKITNLPWEIGKWRLSEALKLS